ncbi:hypothetical protein MACA111363_08205 [Macrococcoides canis]|uniref:Uncharacterized protein n=1 Tax=Macrococcoides canis TaxID=1855823 RepID=A0A1W7ADQ2_9STAP|nr:hypothetical protein MCCS_21540 [Macrococcus canis]
MKHLRLRNKEEYRKMLQILVDYVDTIQITVTGDEDFTEQSLYQAFDDDLIKVVQTKKWPGTIRSGPGAMSYFYPYNTKMANFLKKYNSFYKQYRENGVSFFGYALDGIEADMAFLNEKEIVFYTIAHENEMRIYSESLARFLKGEGYIVKKY